MHEHEIPKTAFCYALWANKCSCNFPINRESLFQPPFLHKFVVVFSNDILVYSPALKQNCHHKLRVFYCLGKDVFYFKVF